VKEKILSSSAPPVEVPTCKICRIGKTWFSIFFMSVLGAIPELGRCQLLYTYAAASHLGRGYCGYSAS